ncbi:MAG: alpha/beta fold hydrolase [Planctomycetaceae bacterium]
MFDDENSTQAVDQPSECPPLAIPQESPLPPSPFDPPPGVPQFRPARGLSGAHRQTLLATYISGRPGITDTVPRKIRLPDGDFVVLHDDQPANWRRGDLVVLLMHGLTGCHRSGYMMRIAAKLKRQGVRVFRMDHRGCGAGRRLAANPYHAGRTEDVQNVLETIERICPGSPVSVAGFSLSGNLLLKYLGQHGGNAPMCIYRAVAVCPPIDLMKCMTKLGASRAGLRYDWHFSRTLVSQISNSPQWRDNVPLAEVRRLPRRLYEFDDLYTAPASGFRSVEEYYRTASSKDVISNIRVHTTILAAEDDPLIDAEPLLALSLPGNVTRCVTRNGGHLGFIGRRGVDQDRRWMDWRVMEWLQE